jgi:hypothetical protein
VISPLSRFTDLTIGTVESVAPGEVKVLLDPDAPQATALNTGQPTRFPRLNGFVLLPNEAGAMVGLVTWLGIERSAFPKRTGLRDFGLVDLPFPSRRLSVNPVGTLRATRDEHGAVTYELERGVVAFPSVGDPVLLPTDDQLRAIIEAAGTNRRLPIGVSPLAGDATVSVDPDRLFGRHLAILGNTGSGKSCSVAGLIRWSLHAAEHPSGQPHARFVILDPNGEYTKAFADLGQSVQVYQPGPPRAGAKPLTVPAWIWNSHEWAAFTRASTQTQQPLLVQALRSLRAGTQAGAAPPTKLARLLKGYRAMLAQRLGGGPGEYSGFGKAKNCGVMLQNLGSGAAPYLDAVPEVAGPLEDLLQAVGQTAESRFWSTTKGLEGFDDFSEPELVAIREAIDAVLDLLPDVPEGGANEDAPIPFDPHELADHLELLADGLGQSAHVGGLLIRIRTLLADERLGPVIAPKDPPTFEDWLASFLGSGDSSLPQITVLDLSLIPADTLHLITAVIARVLFEATQRYRKLRREELPTVLVLEEAHSFIRWSNTAEVEDAAADLCRKTFERIAREGRKFGLGLVLSSQRPSELSATVLAQCNTFLLHRVVNDRDQDLLKRLVPDNLAGLFRELPNLPSRQAILLGWAAPVPVLVEINELLPEHRPNSADPRFWEIWTGAAPRPLEWPPVVQDWIGTTTLPAET